MGNANTKLARWSSSCCCCTTTDGSSPATSSGPPFQVNEVEDLDKMMNYLLLQFKEKNKEQIGSKAIEYASESTTWMRDRVQTCVEWAGQLKSAGTDDICSCTGKVFKEQALAREMGQNLTKVLGEVGKLHWACAGLSLLAYVLTRMDNTSSNYTHCYDVMFRLVDLWWEMIRPLLSEGQGRVKEKVQKGIDLILRGVAYCEMVTHASAAIRFFCLETQQKRLVDFDNEIERFRRETHEILDVKMFVETRVPKSIPSEEMEHAVGLTRRVEAVLKMLNMEEQEKTIAVVLHGMGGIGKSTLADAVDRQVRVSRRCRVLLGHNPSEDRISSLQRTMVEKLTMSSTHSETDAEAVKQRLREVLTEGRDNVSGGSNSKPMFIYIDNVLRKEDLTALLSLDFEHVHLPKGSGLLITTRDMAVCTDVLQRNPEIEVKTYQTELLTKEEAKELLCRHAFQAEQPPHESRYEEMIEDVVTACGFLPLALRVLGRQLYHVLKTNNNHPFEREWKSSIEKLKSGQGNVMNALRYSYDLLQEPDQMAFLLVSTCCVGEEWRRTREIVESLYPLASLATLQDFALVQRYIDYDYEEEDVIGRVAMHDLLVTLGHNIAGNRAKVFNNDDDQQNIAWSEIQWLRLNKDIDLDITILDECENLEALFLVKTNFVGSTTKVPLKLKVLDIQRKVSWESMWNLDSLGGLVYLACKQCSNFPVSTKLQLLRGYNGDEIPEQVISSSSRQQLRVLSCRKVVRLTTSFCHNMTKLEVLEIGMAGKDDDIDWPDADFGGLKHLRVLKLRMPGLRTILPSTFNNLRDLQTLHIFCPGLQDLPPLSFSHLSALQHLRIYSTKVTSLPDDFAMLADSLEALFLCGQPWKALPPVIWKLTRLHHLVLMGMPNLETLQLAGEPGICMNSLRALVVLECHSLQEMETHSFKSLEILCIQSAKSLKRIFVPQPHMQDSTFLSLRTLLLVKCPSLEELPQLGIYMRSLKVLILEDCASLESLPLDTDQIRSNMDNVVVLNCASLQRNLPPESSALPNVIMDLNEDMDVRHLFNISGFTYMMDFHE